jgi:hypothetical protein
MMNNENADSASALAGGMTGDIDAIKMKIEATAELDVVDHPAAYEEIHSDLQRALAEIEGL